MKLCFFLDRLLSFLSSFQTDGLSCVLVGGSALTALQNKAESQAFRFIISLSLTEWLQSHCCFSYNFLLVFSWLLRFIIWCLHISRQCLSRCIVLSAHCKPYSTHPANVNYPLSSLLHALHLLSLEWIAFLCYLVFRQLTFKRGSANYISWLAFFGTFLLPLFQGTALSVFFFFFLQD